MTGILVHRETSQGHARVFPKTRGRLSGTLDGMRAAERAVALMHVIG